MTLGPSLLALSRAAKDAYDAALDAGRPELALELERLGGVVAALIAVTLRGELERVAS